MDPLLTHTTCVLCDNHFCSGEEFSTLPLLLSMIHSVSMVRSCWIATLAYSMVLVPFIAHFFPIASSTPFQFLIPFNEWPMGHPLPIAFLLYHHNMHIQSLSHPSACLYVYVYMSVYACLYVYERDSACLSHQCLSICLKQFFCVKIFFVLQYTSRFKIASY